MAMMIALSFFSRDMVAVVSAGGCTGAECTETGLMVLDPSISLYRHDQGPVRLWPLVRRGEGACRVEPVIKASNNGNQGLVGL